MMNVAVVILVLLTGYTQSTDYIPYAAMLADVLDPINSIEIDSRYLGRRMHYLNDSIHFHCPKLFKSASDSLPPRWPPPLLDEFKSLSMLSSFTLDNRVPIIFNQMMTYWAEKQLDGGIYQWSYDLIENYAPGKDNVPAGAAAYCYGNSFCADAIAKYSANIVGKVGMVVGSQHPWAEAMLVKAGAAKITTIEYMRINSSHPKVDSLTPDELSERYVKQYVQKNISRVDFVFSYSSLEHDGLGRYGDPINPVADLESMAKMHCLLKPDGLFFLGIPVGPDSIVYNAHRVYGKYRLSIILKYWELIDVIGSKWRVNDMSKLYDYFASNQPILVLRPKYHRLMHSSQQANFTRR